MYNRYIPNQARYEPAAGPAAPPPPHRPPSKGGLGTLLGSLGSGEGIGQSVSTLLKTFHLDDLDTGDILLALIVLFLILEDGDNLDLIITLGLMILFSLGEK